MVINAIGLLAITMSLSVSAHTPYEVGSCHVFKRNSYRLHPACQDVLRFKVLPAMKKLPPEKMLLIEGFRAPDEEEGLDLKRVKAVREWLVKGRAGATADPSKVWINARGVIHDNSQVRMTLVPKSITKLLEVL